MDDQNDGRRSKKEKVTHASQASSFDIGVASTLILPVAEVVKTLDDLAKVRSLDDYGYGKTQYRKQLLAEHEELPG